MARRLGLPYSCGVDCANCGTSLDFVIYNRKASQCDKGNKLLPKIRKLHFK